MCGLIGALLAQPSLTDERIGQALATIAHRWGSRGRPAG